MNKIIIVCGGVISGCGKGVAAASIGAILKMRGHSVELMKFDPYLSTDAGVLAPREHGEVFLCDDGTECDLDLGHYQRIADACLTKHNIYTSGQLQKELIQRQEDGENLGNSLQIIPHLTNLINEKIEFLANNSEVLIIEIGGTVGDLESGVFYKTAAQLKSKYADDCLVVMVAPILWIKTIKELKTKPLQRSVNDLQSFGIQPDILLCRVDREIPSKILEKISDMTYIPKSHIFEAPDVKTIYQVPLEFYERHIDDLICDKLRLGRKTCKIHKHKELVERYLKEGLKEVTIAICGKYQNCHEAYLSLSEALDHAGVEHNVRVNIKWIGAEDLEAARSMKKFFEDVDGLIVPGGFDSRGVEGKIKAIKYAREKKIPFLGICLGLQCAAIEVARNLCGINAANSSEFDKDTKHPIVHWVPGQEELTKKVGTMRLGAYDCELAKNTIAMGLYRRKLISERHRHRYEINPHYVGKLEKKGFIVSGKNPESGLVEIMELKGHPFFIGTQAHPEFKSRLGSAAPLFSGLISATLQKKS